MSHYIAAIEHAFKPFSRTLAKPSIPSEYTKTCLEKEQQATKASAGAGVGAPPVRKNDVSCLLEYARVARPEAKHPVTILFLPEVPHGL